MNTNHKTRNLKQRRWLLYLAAIFHFSVTIFILWVGNTNWIPGLFTSQGVGTFNIDNIPYMNQVEDLVAVFNQDGLATFTSLPVELHVKIYALSFMLLSPLFGFSILSAEIVNLFYYLGIIYLVYALGKAIFNHQSGMIAAVVVGLWPSFIIHTTQLLKTPLFVIAMLMLVLTNGTWYRRRLTFKAILVSAGFYLLSLLILLTMLEHSGRKPLTDVVIAMGLIGVVLQKIALWLPKSKKLFRVFYAALGVFLLFFIISPQLGILAVPDYLELASHQADWVVQALSTARERFIASYPSAGSNIDTHYLITDLRSLLIYLPRAALIGFFAPFPNMWFVKGNIGVSPRVLSGVEALLMYAVYAMALIGVWQARRKPATWYLVAVAGISLTTLGVVVTNIGALFRMRYAYWMILIALGAGGFHHIVLPGMRVLWANFSGGVKQIIMSDFHICSPILLVANWDWVLYNFHLPLARELERNGQNVIPVCPPGRYTDSILTQGFNWQPWGLDRRSLYPWRELRSVFELYKIYRDLRPIAVHHFTIKPILYGSLAARFLQIKTVINNFTGLGYLFSDAPKAAWLRRIVLPVLRRALRGKGFHTAFQNDYNLEYLASLGLVSKEDTTTIPGAGD